MQDPVDCPTSCPAPPAETVTITHVVLAEPHGEYICVVDAETGQLRDATKDEKYSMAGGRFQYEFDRHLGVPVRGVVRLLGELCRKGIRLVAKKMGFNILQTVESMVRESCVDVVEEE